jgi:tetratricopeptide (TPR) repeat protein
LNNLLRNGRELWDSGDLIEIEAAFRRALELAESRGGPEAPETIFPLRELATVVACIPDRFPEALDLLRRALHIAETHFGPDDPRLIDLLSYLGTKLWTFRAYDEAAEHYRRALTISERSHGDGGMTAYLLTNLASILLEAGSTQDALPLAERALRIEEAKQNPPSDCGIVAAILVVRRCLLALEKKPEALAHCERVLALYEPRHPEPDNRVVRELRSWIEELRKSED